MLFAALEPFADRWAVGPFVSWGRSIASSASSPRARPVRHRRAAAHRSDHHRPARQAPVFEAQANYDLANVLVERGAVADRARATEALDRCLGIAAELSWTRSNSGRSSCGTLEPALAARSSLASRELGRTGLRGR